MSKDYYVHWLLGFLLAIIWFWGDKIGIPPAAIQLASVTVPVLLGHALGKSQGITDSVDTTAAAPADLGPSVGK